MLTVPPERFEKPNYSVFLPEDNVCLMVEMREERGANNSSVRIIPPFSMLESLGLETHI